MRYAAGILILTLTGCTPWIGGAAQANAVDSSCSFGGSSFLGLGHVDGVTQDNRPHKQREHRQDSTNVLRIVR